MEPFYERGCFRVASEVSQSQPTETFPEPLYNDPRVAVMIEPRFQPSLDITDILNDSGSDDASELASSSASDDFLPDVLGQETFELEFFTHRRYLAPYASRPTATAEPSSPSRRPSTTIASEILGRITHPDVRRWFRRPYDPEFLVHLLDLYFYWIHPSYQMFSREHFLRDFQSGRTDHCSRILANAIAAFACRYSDRTAALADPNDLSTAGYQFFAEAERLLQHGGESPLMLAQALSIMSSRELACGRIFTSRSYAERCQSMEYQHAPYPILNTTGIGCGFVTPWEIPQRDHMHMPGCW